MLFPFWFLNQGETSIYQSKTKEIPHEIAVHHPGKGVNNIEEVTLIEVQNKKRISIQYYMDVESVICLEEVCKVVSVKIYWNSIGEFLKYKLDEGITLEKYEADVFEDNDYIKLHNILANTASPFKNVGIDEILKVPDQTHNEVDAVSGATALDLNEEDTVPGAALTCYTLWHWGHGDIQSIIRNITGESLNKQAFLKLLNSENEEKQLFAIEQLKEQKNENKSLVKAVVKQTTNNGKLLKVTIDYLESANSEIYFTAIQQLFQQGNQQQKIMSLNSLLNSKKEFPKGYLDALSEQVSSFSTFQEVSLFLRLMKVKNVNSIEVVKNVFPLLERNLIIGRSAYWFLKNQRLTAEQQERLDLFQKKHENQF